MVVERLEGLLVGNDGAVAVCAAPGIRIHRGKHRYNRVPSGHWPGAMGSKKKRGRLGKLTDQLFSQLAAGLGEFGPLGVQVLKIIWINILLSGDNAIVIALACRGLPPKQRFWGIVLGAGAAVGLRIFFTVILAYVLELPWLRLVGGLLLLWIAVKLLVQDEADEHPSKAATTFGARCAPWPSPTSS
jgi:hypothetical protein